MSIKALLIGCGNIGAQYDLKKPARVWSHAKAYSLINDLELTVTDADGQKAREVAAIYHSKMITKPDEEDYKNFDLISITTPTSTHAEYLKKILERFSGVVICEKPVVGLLGEIDDLSSGYERSASKVLVNYIRRYQPGYKKAKEKLEKRPDRFSFKEIIIKYRRGILNNASHAVDLLEYLYDQPFAFKGFCIHKIEFDSFEDDPTITGGCFYLDQPVSFIGLCHIDYPVFEIEIFYSDSKIVICHNGNEIRYYAVGNSNELTENLAERQKNILDSYMEPVINEALDLLYKRKTDDNFMQTLEMNQRILQIIEPVKKK